MSITVVLKSWLSGSVNLPALFFFRLSLASGPLTIPYEFEDLLFTSVGKGCWNFGKDCIESADHFG